MSVFLTILHSVELQRNLSGNKNPYGEKEYRFKVINEQIQVVSLLWGTTIIASKNNKEIKVIFNIY